MVPLEKKEVFVPQLGWEFYDQSYYQNDFDECKTRLLNIENLEKYFLMFSHFQ